MKKKYLFGVVILVIAYLVTFFITKTTDIDSNKTWSSEGVLFAIKSSGEYQNVSTYTINERGFNEKVLVFINHKLSTSYHLLSVDGLEMVYLRFGKNYQDQISVDQMPYLQYTYVDKRAANLSKNIPPGENKRKKITRILSYNSSE